jgi:hypothetical protein
LNEIDNIDRTEVLIVNKLFHDKEYAKEVSAYLDKTCIENSKNKTIIDKYKQFVVEYNNTPSKDEFLSYLTYDKDIKNNSIQGLIDQVEDIYQEHFDDYNLDSLMDLTEKYFQETKLTKAIMLGADILETKDKQKKRYILPELFREALKINFKNNVGLEYRSDDFVDAQYHYYTHPDARIAFPDWPYFTALLKGGCYRKSLNCLVAGTGVFKTGGLVNIAKQYIKAGLNVLYITLEVNENAIAERFDINILNIKSDDLVLKYPTKKKYKLKMEELKSKYSGRLRIKEFPTAGANVMHFKSLFDELKVKEDFEPDVLIVDYLNIASSIRYNNLGDTYNYVKAIAEELRGLCVEKNLIGWTATQFRRGNDNVSDANLEDVSESSATAFTMDSLIAILETEEMRDDNKLLFKIIKSRYDKLTSASKFVMNVDKTKQQLTELSSADPEQYKKQKEDQDAKAEKAFYKKPLKQIANGGWNY